MAVLKETADNSPNLKVYSCAAWAGLEALLCKILRIHFLSVHFSTIPKVCPCLHGLLWLHPHPCSSRRLEKGVKKQGQDTWTNYPLRKVPWPFHTLLLISYCPELSHMATSATREPGKYSIYPGGHVTCWTFLIYGKRERIDSGAQPISTWLYEALRTVLG